MGWQRHQQDHVKIIYALLQMNQPNNTIRPDPHPDHPVRILNVKLTAQ